MKKLRNSREDLVSANVTSSCCFEGELVKVLQSENPLETSTQTSKDSPTAICPFGNTISCPSEDIGSALCSSDGLSSPSHSPNISDPYTTTVTYNCSLFTTVECYYCKILKVLKHSTL